MQYRWSVSRTFLLCLALAIASPAAAASYYTSRPEDPHAVYLTRERFAAVGDGVADDTDAIQNAIDAVQESTGEGIVFVPEGRYRISRTLYVWPSIRVIGYGAHRPALVLGPRTPGFDDPSHERQLVFFAGRRPAAGTPPEDANPGTFYSALSNVDLEIQDGNPGAVGVRAKYAQHCFTSHVEFRIGSGLAGVHEGGNVAEDVRFIGGEYGIWTGTPSPGWQYTVVDASFEGQRRAAIREHEAGLTLIRPRFTRVPTAIDIEEGSPDELWVKDARLDDVSGPAFVISFESNPRTEINMEGIVCRRVPVFAAFRESGRRLAAPAAIYAVSAFTHGLGYADIGAPGTTMDVFDARTLNAWPEPAASDLVPLPDASTWVNVRTLGAKGDGASDDTEAFRSAIASHRAIYVPTGKYIVTDTLLLRPDTVLIGLHPSATQLVIPDRTAAFQGIGPPIPLLDTPKGGTNVVIGIGLYTNGINPRAVAARWRAGRALDDERRALPGRPRHERIGWQARESVQQHAQRRSGSCSALGFAVSESLGHRWGRRNVLRSVDTEHIRTSGHARERHVHERPRLPDLERASCALRGADQARVELGDLRVADRRRTRRERILLGARDRRVFGTSRSPTCTCTA